MRLSTPQIGICKSLAAGYGLESERRDEFLGGAGQDGIHLGPRLGQFGSQFDGLVGRDGAGNTEQDLLVAED